MNPKNMHLSIELVPTTCWYSNVRSNVSPSTWDRLQFETFQAANHRCELCGGKGRHHPVECHEIWFYDDHRMIQKLDRLIALCPNCHEVKHIGFAIKQGRAAQVTEWLCTVNKITAEQAFTYIQYAFEVHNIRSQFKWQLDLTVLSNKYGIHLDKYGIEQGFNNPR